jgi:hypothetical protein
MGRTYKSAVTIQDSLESMRHTDDCIAEIAALLKRLNKVKRQLLAQKEYIDKAIIDAHYMVYYDGSNNPISPTNPVDYRVKLYKHRNIIGRLKNPTTSDDTTIVEPGNTIEAKEAESRVVMRKKIFQVGYKLETNDYVPIFQNDQVLSNLNSEEIDSNNVFNGLDIVGAKQFFIGVNAILTHPNNISETLTPTPYFYRHLVDWNNASSYPTDSATILPVGVYFKNDNNLSFTETNDLTRDSSSVAGLKWIIDRATGDSALKNLAKNTSYSHLWNVTNVTSPGWEDFTVTFKTSEIDRPYKPALDESDKREFYSYSEWDKLGGALTIKADRYYTPGLKHALSTGILKGLLMQGNENITGTASKTTITYAIPADGTDSGISAHFEVIRGFGLD